MSVLKNSGVSISYYLRFKLLQGLISAVCAGTMIKIYARFSGRTLLVFESADLPAGTGTFDLFTADTAASFYSLFFSSAASAAMVISFYLAAVLFSGSEKKK